MRIFKTLYRPYHEWNILGFLYSNNSKIKYTFEWRYWLEYYQLWTHNTYVTLPAALFERTMRASVCVDDICRLETRLYGDLNLYYFHFTTILSLRKRVIIPNLCFKIFLLWNLTRFQMIISLRTRTCNVRIYQVRKQSPPFIHRLVNSYPILIPDKNSTEASSILKRVFACIRIYPKKKKILIDPRNLCQENGYIFFTTCRITLKFLTYGFPDIPIAVCTKNGRKIRKSYPSVTKDFLSIFLARQQQKGPSVPTDKTFVCKHFVHRFFFIVGGHLFIYFLSRSSQFVDDL